MLNIFVFLSFLAGVDMGGGFHCLFPGETVSEKPIKITMEPHPSLKDRPGLYRVMMSLNGVLPIRAHAQPITKTPGRDVVIRGRLGKSASYTVGLREDGFAALNLKTASEGADPQSRLTRTGKCRGHRAAIERWLP